MVEFRYEQQRTTQFHLGGVILLSEAQALAYLDQEISRGRDRLEVLSELELCASRVGFEVPADTRYPFANYKFRDNLTDQWRSLTTIPYPIYGRDPKDHWWASHLFEQNHGSL